MAGNPASRKTFGAAFCAVRNVKNKTPAAPCFYCGFYKAALLEKLNGKCSFLRMVRNYFFQAHMQRVLLAGLGRAPPEHRQGVNAESATHPRAARFPGFSEWSLLELKGCSWGGGYKFTRGYLAPDSLHKSTSKSEQTFFFFFLFCLPQAMNFWTLLLRVEIWQDSRGLLICILLICTAHNSHKHMQSKHVSPYFSEKI